MNFDANSFAFGAVGLAVGIGAHFWMQKTEMERRCEFMDYLKRDLTDAFDASDEVLASSDTPPAIRNVLLHLLAAHANRERGEEFARLFVTHGSKPNKVAPDGSDPISQAMGELSRENPGLARQTHHALASLSFALVFLNLADNIKIEKVQDEAARDPVSLWARIARMFGSNDHTPREGGGLLHA